MLLSYLLIVLQVVPHDVTGHVPVEWIRQQDGVSLVNSRTAHWKAQNSSSSLVYMISIWYCEIIMKQLVESLTKADNTFLATIADQRQVTCN